VAGKAVAGGAYVCAFDMMDLRRSWVGMTFGAAFCCRTNASTSFDGVRDNSAFIIPSASLIDDCDVSTSIIIHLTNISFNINILASSIVCIFSRMRGDSVSHRARASFSSLAASSCFALPLPFDFAFSDFSRLVSCESARDDRFASNCGNCTKSGEARYAFSGASNSVPILLDREACDDATLPICNLICSHAVLYDLNKKIQSHV